VVITDNFSYRKLHIPSIMSWHWQCNIRLAIIRNTATEKPRSIQLKRCWNFQDLLKEPITERRTDGFGMRRPLNPPESLVNRETGRLLHEMGLVGLGPACTGPGD